MPIVNTVAAAKIRRLLSRRPPQYIFTAHVDVDSLVLIREVTNKGRVIGDDRFKDEIELLTGRSV